MLISQRANIVRYDNGTLVKLVASAHAFVSYDYDPETRTGTYTPDAIVVSAKYEGNVKYGKWQYSKDGETWNDVSAQEGISFSSSSFTIQSDCGILNDGESITIKCVGDDGVHYDTITIAKEVNATTVYDRTHTSIEQTNSKISLIASEEQLRQFSEQQTMATKMASIDVKADGIRQEVTANYATKTYAETQASTQRDVAKAYADTKASTAENNAKGYADTKASAAESNAKDYADGRLEDYSTTIEMQSAIDQKADSITSTVSRTYSTKTEAQGYANTAQANAISTAAVDATAKAGTAKSEAISTASADASSKATQALNSAKADTTEKLKSYSTTAQMNTAIQQKADSITSTVSTTYQTKVQAQSDLATAKGYADTAEDNAKDYADGAASDAQEAAEGYTDTRLQGYSTTTQMNSAIDQKAGEITASVSRTYATKTELESATDGTVIFQTPYTHSNNKYNFSAVVYKNGEDVTASYADSQFYWYLKDESSAEKQYLKIGKTVSVNEELAGYGATVVGQMIVSDPDSIVNASGISIVNASNVEIETLVRKSTLEIETSIFQKDYIKEQFAQINIAYDSITSEVREKYSEAIEYTDSSIAGYDSVETEKWSTINQTVSGINIEVGKKVNSTEIISAINLSQETATIKSGHISLEGLITANNGFKINTDGSFEAVSGKIGNFTVNNNAIYSGSKNSSNSNAPGIYMDGSGVFNIGNASGYIKYSPSNGISIVANNITLSTGQTLAGAYTAASTAEANAINHADTVTLASAEGYTDQLDNSLTQAEVYKRLTNNRANQGIYIESGNVYVDASKIATGFLSSERIEAKSIDVSKLNVGNLSAISSNLGSITAGQINIGNGTFTVSPQGVLTATGATISGTVTATYGQISGSIVTSGINAANITVGKIQATQLSVSELSALSSNLGSVTAGQINIGNGAFTVSPQGVLSARGANITGTINATSGTFSGTVTAGSFLGGSNGMKVTNDGGLSGGNLTIKTSGINAYTPNGASFNVTSGGTMTVTGGSYTGSVQSGSSIGALPVTSTGLSYTSGSNTMSLTTSGLSMGSSVSLGVGGTGKISNIIVDTNAIYSVGHTAYDSDVKGFYLDKNGYFGVGGDKNYLHFNQSNGRLDIKVNSFSLTDGRTIDSIASSAVTNYVTQQNLVDILTASEQNAGIFLSNGKLRINASMITTGTLAANRIAANSIEASKLSITSLDSISNMMSGIHIESNKIFSGSHSAYNSSYDGFCLESGGSFGVGNNGSYIRFNATTGEVSIKATSFSLSNGSSIQSIAQSEAYSAQLAAQSYADGKAANALSSANSYSDEILDAGKDYTDTKATATLNSAKSDASTKATNALNSANSHSDGLWNVNFTQENVISTIVGSTQHPGIYLDQGELKIIANSVSVDNLAAISANLGNITAGSITIGSGNYSFGLASNGKLTCSGADIRGYVGTGITLDGANSKITLSGYRGDSYIDGSTGQAAFGELTTYRNLTVGELLTSGTGNITAYGKITSYGRASFEAGINITSGGMDVHGNNAQFQINTVFYNGYDHKFHGAAYFYNLPSDIFNITNAVFDSTGRLIKDGSSSKRYKEIAGVISEEEIQKAYGLNAYSARYKKGYLTTKDKRAEKYIPMLIAEDVEETIPDAVIYNGDGTVENWNYRVIIPVHQAMLVSQDRRIRKLEAEIKELKKAVQLTAKGE